MNTPTTFVHRARLIARLREHIEEIEGFARDLDPALLRERPDPGRWSIHEHILHLGEVQDIFTERIAHMLMGERPRITPFLPDEARSRGAYLDRNLEEGLRTLRRQRENLLTLLATIDESEWLREGEHPEMKHYTVELCAEALLRHEEHHLYTMFNLYFGNRE